MVGHKNTDKTRCGCFNAMPCGDMMKKMVGDSESGDDFNCMEMMKRMWGQKNKGPMGDWLKTMKHMCSDSPSESTGADKT